MKTKSSFGGTTCAAMLLLLTLPSAALADDYTWTTNNGAITITGYIGPGGDVSIPDTITFLPVTSIWLNAFATNNSVTSVTIPDSVTSIGQTAFAYCSNLTTITIGNGATSIGFLAFTFCTSLRTATLPNGITSVPGGVFYGCSSLASVTIPNSVTSIEPSSFVACTSLSSVTIPSGVTSLGSAAFWACSNLAALYFKGNAPTLGHNVFNYDNNATVYYLPGKTGWDLWSGASFPTPPPAVLWKPLLKTTDASFGVLTNQFGFTVAWASGMNVAVDACTDLGNLSWTPLQTNTLSDDLWYFGDPDWTNYPTRFYRLRSVP